MSHYYLFMQPLISFIFFPFGFVPLSRDETQEVGRVLIAFSNPSPLGHR